MPGDKRQRFRLPAPVFHKLARQLDRIPRHPTDAGNASSINAGQHVVQTMAKLVEQGNHFIVREQRRFAVYRAVEVTGQISDRFCREPSSLRIWPTQSSIHARRVYVRGHTGQDRSCRAARYFVIQLEETHFRMPHIDIGTLFGGNAINTLNHFKQAVNGFVFRKYGRSCSSLML